MARPLNQTRGTVLYRGIALDYYHTRDQLSVSWQDASRIVEGRQDGITVWRFDPAYGWRNEFVELLWISLAGNGEQAAVQGEENAVQLWDISGDPRNWRGQALSGLEADLDFFSFVAWSPAGNHFAYCAQSEIKLWRRNSSGYWTSYQVLEADSLSWSSDEQQLATSEGNIVEVWDLGKDGNQFEKKQLLPVISECASMAFSPDSAYLACMAKDNTLSVWPRVDGRWSEEWVTRLNHTNPRNFQWHPLSKSLAISADGGVHIWQVFTPGGPGGLGDWHLMHVLPDRDFASPVSSITWSHDGQHLVAGGATPPLHVWSIFGTGGWQKSRSFERTTNRRQSPSRWALSANGFLATRILHGAGALEYWSPTEEAAGILESDDGDRMRSHGVSSTGLQLLILTKSWTQHWVASGSGGSSARWQLSAKHRVRSGCSVVQVSIRWSPDDRRVALACGHWIRIFEPTGNGSLQNPFSLSIPVVRDRKNKEIPIGALAWSPNSDCLVFGWAGTIHTWRPGDRHAVRHEGQANHTKIVVSVAWSRNGQLIASASREQIFVWRWNATDEKFQQVVRFPTNANVCRFPAYQWDLGPRLVWKFDDSYLVTSECDGKIHFRDEGESFQVDYTRPVQGQVQAMAWSDNSLNVLSSSLDSESSLLQTWSLPSGGFLLTALGFHFPTADPLDWMTRFCSSTHVHCSCQKGRCEVSLALSAAQIEWRALQCGADSRRIGAELVFIRELQIHWSGSAATQELPDSGASLCEHLSSFKHLRSLVLREPTADGFWMCPLSAPMLEHLGVQPIRDVESCAHLQS